MKILADFDKLISEQTGNTGLRCLIIINVAYLQRTSLPQYEIKLYPAPFFVSDATTYSIPWAFSKARGNLQHNHMNCS